MQHTYVPQGTCSTRITFELEGDVVHNIHFTGGCNGNLQAVSRLVEGMTIDEVVTRIGGIRCGFKSTSCADQLSKALQQAQQSEAAETDD